MAVPVAKAIARGRGGSDYRFCPPRGKLDAPLLPTPSPRPHTSETAFLDSFYEKIPFKTEG
ncbi:MAG: hypothetical protein [Olavius algarvensis Gamma 1 endosymbiont]|nr:MAG: hypothetical protein [Olavius algarvensis Gamma 1 endosymbiont]